MKRQLSLCIAGLALALAGCVTAEPGVVARAVNATLTAVITPTPIVVVVTAVGVQNRTIATVTPAPPATASLPPTATAIATLPPAPVRATSPLTPTVTPSATGTAVPTPTITPGVYGRLVYQDDFTQVGTWDLGAADSVQSKTIANGMLSVTIKQSDRFVVVYKTQSVPDLYIQITAQAPTCDTRDRYGLVFRVQDVENYYLFDVDCDGRYRLAKMVQGNLTALVDWTANAAVNVGAGAVNALTVRAVGTQMAVSANSHSLAKVTDDTFRLGGFGFSVGSGLTAPYTATFQSLHVWETLP